jgi:tagaturonate reductase
MLKVRILNGAHTSMIPYALLRGVATVGECMKDEILRAHLEGCLFEEILPALEFDPKEAMDYAQSVIRRFENPHISHACAAISLNSVSKFKVRVLPSILAYRNKFGKNPMHLTFALAKLIDFYKTGTPRDEAEAVEALQKGSIAEILSNTALWGMDLSFLTEEVAQYADSSK